MLFKILFFSYILIYSVISNELINSSIISHGDTPETEITPTDNNFTNEFDYINVDILGNSNNIIPRLLRYVPENESVAVNEYIKIKSNSSENSTNNWIATPLKKTYSGNYVRTYKVKPANLNRRGVLNKTDKVEVLDYLRDRRSGHTSYPYQLSLKRRKLRDLIPSDTNFDMYGDIHQKYLSGTVSNETYKGNIFDANVRKFPNNQNRTIDSKIYQKNLEGISSEVSTPYLNRSFSEYLSNHLMFATSKPFTNKAITLYTVPGDKSKFAAKIKNRYTNEVDSKFNFDVYGNHLGNNDLDKGNDVIQGENMHEMDAGDDEDFSDTEHNPEDAAENSNDMSQIENLNRDFEENEYDPKDDNDYAVEDNDSMSRSEVTTPRIQKYVDKNDFAFYGDASVELKFTESPKKTSHFSNSPVYNSPEPKQSENDSELTPGNMFKMSKVFPEDLPNNKTINTNYLVKPKVLRDITNYYDKGMNVNLANKSDLQGFLNQDIHYNIQRHNSKKIGSTERYFNKEESRDDYQNSFEEKSMQNKVGNRLEEYLVGNKKKETDTKDLEPDVEPRSYNQNSITEYYQKRKLTLNNKKSEDELPSNLKEEIQDEYKHQNSKNSRKISKSKVTQQPIQKEDKKYPNDSKESRLKEDYSKEESLERTMERKDEDEDSVTDETRNNLFPLHFKTVSNAELNYPYVVMYVYEPNQVYCDAVTISAYWILSSATCLIHSYDDQSKRGYVSFCSSTWWNTEFTAIVLEAMIQKKYFATTERKDGANVGVARVAKDMSLCSTWYAANIIKKPLKADKEGSTATAIGWGLYRIRTLEKDFDDAKVPNTELQSVESKVMPGLCPGTKRPEAKNNKRMRKYLRSIYYCMQVNPAVEGAVTPEVGGVLIMRKYVVGIASEITKFDGKRYTLYTAIWNTSDWQHHPSKRDIKPDLQSDPEALLNPLDPDDEHNIHDDPSNLLTPSSSRTEKIESGKPAHNLTLQKNTGKIPRIGIFEVMLSLFSYLFL